VWRSSDGGGFWGASPIKTVALTGGLSDGVKTARSLLTGIGANASDAVFTWFDAESSAGTSWTIKAVKESALGTIITVASGLALAPGDSDGAKVRNTFGDYCVPAINSNNASVIVHGQWNGGTSKVEVHAKIF
jgi:hypothetical protein